MKFELKSLEILDEALKQLGLGANDLTKIDGIKLEGVLLEVAEKLKDNYPYFHPNYADQMMKPPHPISHLAYMLSLWVNPYGEIISQMESEAINEIARMFGWKNAQGHITSSGTTANMEALWVSSQLKPGMKIVASEQTHFTHQRISEVLGLNYETVPCDNFARMNIQTLKKMLDKGNIGTVIATIGTTATGAVDQLQKILELREIYGFRIHADAAYGGYFIIANNLSPTTREVFNSLTQVDSIVIDPHKQGLQPFDCGCVLYKDKSIKKIRQRFLTYPDFGNSEFVYLEPNFEETQSGPSIVALWATQKLMPLDKGGSFSSELSKSREAALRLYDKISRDLRFKTIFKPQLDIVTWALKAERVSLVSRYSEELFRLTASHNLHFALFKYPTKLLKASWKEVEMDQDEVTCLRSCLIKPNHLDCIEQIWQILSKSADEVLTSCSRIY